VKIYLASSWRNLHQPEVVRYLRELGHEVYDFRHPIPDNEGFSWREINPTWRHWCVEDFLEALKHPVSERGFGYDMDALRACDACVLLLPSGRSAHLEAGWAAGAGKRLVIFIPIYDEPELMYLMAAGVVTSLIALRDALKA